MGRELKLHELKLKNKRAKAISKRGPARDAVQEPPLTFRELARLKPLPREFYNRDPLDVARELLGKLLISRLTHAPGTAKMLARGSSKIDALYPSGDENQELLLAGRIVETEAYLGAADPGAHTYNGPTARNAVLFGPPGHAYVYFIYGNHYCTNVSCQPVGDAGGVLLRAVEPVYGIAAMEALRGAKPDSSNRAQELPAVPTLAQLRRLTSGPGRLSQALGITRPTHNGCDLCSRSSVLYIAADDWSETGAAISATPRINVTRAPHWEYRFLLTGNPFVSGKRV